ncbi:hypothetical protein JN10_1499 [Altererythrobacter ishigakiensis]|jgi:hypothetical protein|uniref:Uncharacterized protein n=1 Tax=Altererythrobacter ishigakiensis TaxID=476157 RepID=A0A562UW55_9SPHN|nr:hypothetical protein JN10_1499 [Altererythrobacter ishigakiensis]
MDENGRNGGRILPNVTNRKLIWFGSILLVLFLAWIDGGEEALHPISQEIAVPENAE